MTAPETNPSGPQVKDISDAQGFAAVRRIWATARPDGVTAVEHLADITGAPPRVCQRKLEQMHRRGLIEYGVSIRVSIRFPWIVQPTGAGKIP